MLSGKEILRVGNCNKEGKEITRPGYRTKKFLIPPHSLTNIETEKYYQNEPRFNGVYSTDNLPKKLKDEAYVKNMMTMQILKLIGLLCIFQVLMLFTLIVLQLNMFLKNFKSFLEVKTCKKIYLEYKHMNS